MSTALDQRHQTYAAASLRGIAKTYKHFRLNNIDLEIESGTVNGLIGPNGAGKSTIMRIMMGLVTPDQGTVSVLGHNTQDIEQISDTITFIDRGRVIASKNRDEFLDGWRRFKLQAPHNWQAPAIDGLRPESTFGNLRVMTLDRYQAEVEDRLQSSGATLEASEAMTLEEIFVAAVLRGREEKQL